MLLYHVAAESAATVQISPQGILEGGYPIRQHGPRQLWSEAENAYRWWMTRGKPTRTRYGLTLTSAGQQLWLDEPSSLITIWVS